MEIKIVDNSDMVLEELLEATYRAMWRCGSEATGYAKDLVRVNTGNLRNSITHVVQGKSAIIGTNVSYGLYEELGTGIYAEGGGGRPTPWAYQDANGDWHWTRGNPAHPFLKPAVADHAQTYRNIIEDELKNG